jgi:hypothetical protein
MHFYYDLVKPFKDKLTDINDLKYLVCIKC